MRDVVESKNARKALSNKFHIQIDGTNQLKVIYFKKYQNFTVNRNPKQIKKNILNFKTVVGFQKMDQNEIKNKRQILKLSQKYQFIYFFRSNIRISNVRLIFRRFDHCECDWLIF